ncbi:thiamine biosynthesis protein ApbE [Polaribacter filamentus]|uniref:FAD:protein FMN transferase n=1 Tax=Polaribacter filamentus TaxID=53483 RepID=A0A2S7KKV4_9FLAO|nr:FAD:protein FMN transferase [Polaribacter filamentus]PQB03247.1 thiamine biosynthesis protein ApbE [Polaribacter filamentus]PQB08786.1 thiamine biosynthesis protein ApbE [Polaribacter filamentus]
MKLKIIVAFLIISSILIACKKEVQNRDYTLQGLVFGTTYKITYLNSAINYQDSLDSLFLLINSATSTYISTSDISKINNGDTTIVVDAIFSEVFEKSKRIYKETDGFFDPTVGNLVNAYGFGPENERNNLTEEEIKAQMLFVGLEKISISKGKVVKEDPKIYLDFNAIAKGFGIDLVARFFDEKKIENYLIEIGGEIRAKGTKKNQKPWLIRVVDPASAKENGGFKNINLSNKSMATSGNYRKFRIADDGKKYVHTINPKTGFATESNLLSASVIASKDCADVDAYATAFMAMGLEKTKEFLKKHPEIEVILLFSNTEGRVEEYATYTFHQ